MPKKCLQHIIQCYCLFSEDKYVTYNTQQINRKVNDLYIVESTLNMMQIEITESNVVMPAGQGRQRLGKIAASESIQYIRLRPQHLLQFWCQSAG